MTSQAVSYCVLHETRYPYGSAVSLSQQMLHLSPRACAWQRGHEQVIEIDPQPTWRKDGVDFFGNPVSWLNFDTPHDYLHVYARMHIDVLPHLPEQPLEASMPWEALRERLSYQGQAPTPEDLDATQYLFESPYVRMKKEFLGYADDCFPPGTPVLVGVRALMQKMFDEFEFDPEATTIATPVTEVLEKKRGVCQDFAHFMLACLRVRGIPARYMSGYLLTQPPPGQARLIGADASHAWISVYCPGMGHDWVDFDPTNNLLPDTQHITLAWGRDFGDVSPLRGVILGGGSHEPEVAVTVMPMHEMRMLMQSGSFSEGSSQLGSPGTDEAAPDANDAT